MGPFRGLSAPACSSAWETAAPDEFGSGRCTVTTGPCTLGGLLALSAAVWVCGHPAGAPARGQAPAPAPAEKTPDPAAAAIGGLAVNTLIATNLNIGLAVELLNARKEQLPVVMTVMQQTEKTVGVTIRQLEDYRARVKIPGDDARYLGRILEGLKGVEAQAKSFQKAVEETDKKHMEEFQGHRTKVAGLIKDLTKD
jgi:hypothetical protein